MFSLIDHFTPLSEKEKYYKAEAEKGELSASSLYLPKSIENAARKGREVTLTLDDYMESDLDVFIFRHPRLMPPFKHNHEFVEIKYVLQGNIIREEINDVTFTLSKGDMLIITPGVSHNESTLAEDTIVLNMICRPHVFKELCDETNLNLDNLKILYLRIDPLKIEPIISDMVQEYIEREVDYEMMKKAYFTTLFILSSRSGEIIYKAFHEKQNEDSVSVLEYIDENFRTISLTSFSKHLSITEQYASRMIKQKTGMTFFEIVKKKKLNEAIKLLRSTDMTCKEIAASLQFTPEHFTRLFKSEYGLSPEKMRASLKNPWSNTLFR